MRSPSLPFLALPLAASVALVLAGCASIPEGRSAVDSVDITNAHTLDEEKVEEKLATTASSRFLGLFQGLFFDYEVFDASILQRDLARVERYYRGHGFLEAHARAARVIQVSPDHVRVQIVVDEGPATVVRGVRVDGLEGLPGPVAALARSAATGALPAGARFDEDAYAKARTAVARALTDNGYAYTTLEADARADLAAHAIDYVFTVRPGPSAVFGAITIVDVQDTEPGAKSSSSKPLEEAPLRRALNLTPGDAYSTAAIDAATQALLDLEVLSSAQIVPTLSDPPSPVVPLTVKVQPSKMHQVRLGGGFEFDEIKTELHGLIGWEDHDFLGNLRNFSIDFKPGVVLYPLRVNYITVPTNPLPEERLRLQLRQPGFLEPRTTFFAQPEGNVFPMLVAPNPDPSQPVLGYGELKATVGPRAPLRQARARSRRPEIPGRDSVPVHFDPARAGAAHPHPLVPAARPRQLDLRDDPIHPHAGFYAANDFTVAGGPFGGTASDIRIQPEIRGYVPVAHGVTFAARGSLGLLFAFNYGDYVQHYLFPPLNPSATSHDRLYNKVDRDIEIVYFRGFFSGGPSSNRGYPLRGIAPHGIVPFLSPVTLQEQQASSQGGVSCVPNTPHYDASKCSIPIGGFTLWEASAEVRFDVSGPFGAATFCDMGDAAPEEVQIRLSHLHLSCGVGARYDTPVGAIRLDLAYRIQPLQVLGYKDEAAAYDADPLNGAPQPTFFGIPIAFSFGIGETF